MAPAAYWKGYLKLSLVTCAVQMTPATTRASRVGFRTLNRKTGNRLRIQMIDEGSGEPVEDDDMVKGYEVAKGEYVMLSDEELDDVALDSTHTIDISSFVPRDEVDARYLDKPYYLAPDDDVAREPFAVIRDAMEASGKVGLGRVVMNWRERIAMLEPRGKGILVWRLKYAYEVRGEEAAFERVTGEKADPEALKVMGEFIRAKRGAFDPKALIDPLQEAHLKLIEAKKARRTLPSIKIGAAAPAQSERKVVSILEALKRSVAAEKKARAPAKALPAAGRKKAAAPPRRKAH